LNAYVYVENLPTVMTDPTGADTREGLGVPINEPLSQEEINRITDPQTREFCIDNPLMCRGLGYVQDDQAGGSNLGPGDNSSPGGPGSGESAGSGNSGSITVTVSQGDMPTVSSGTTGLVQTSDFFAQVEGGGDASATGWQVGDPVNVYTKSGDYPSWSAARQRFWKNEAFLNPEQYSAENLDRMSNGLAPLDETGRSYQIHHIYGRGIPDPHNPFNLQVVTWWEHWAIHYFPIIP